MAALGTAHPAYAVYLAGDFDDGPESWSATCACGWYQHGNRLRTSAVAALGYHWRTCRMAGVTTGDRLFGVGR